MLEFINKVLFSRAEEDELYQRYKKKSSSTGAIFVGLVAAVGGFLYGFDTGLINDILEMKYVKHKFTKNGEFSVHERALVTAILSLGTFFGALTAPLISDRYGRKFSIILSAALTFNIGNILQVIANSLTLLCIGRAITGLAVGVLSASVPLYQAEASPRWVRGSIVYTYQWAITWGLLIASAICQGTKSLHNSASYRIPVGLQFLWALILCTGMLFLPESPRYYVQKNNLKRALGSLSRLRKLPETDEDLIEELVEIKANYDYEMSFGKVSYIDCFRTGGGRSKQKLRMFTGMGVQAFQQLSGINFIFYYGVNFFAVTGLKNYYLMSFITYLVNTVCTIPGIILIEAIGRRHLLIFGGVGMGVSNLIIAIAGVTISNAEVSAIICVCFSCVFISIFASSWGGGAWSLTSDIYSISIRQKAVSITAASNWIVNFVLAYVTPYMIDTGANTAALGTKIFFIWGGCNLASAVFVYFLVYETQGLRLEEIDMMYSNCSNALVSPNFKSKRILQDSEIAEFMHTQFNYSQGDTGSLVANSIILHSSTKPDDASLGTDVSSANLEMSGKTKDSEKNDYEKYLDSLKDDIVSTHDNSNSSVSRRVSIPDPVLKLSMEYPEFSTSSAMGGKATVIATSYFNNPPESDTDTDTDLSSAESGNSAVNENSDLYSNNSNTDVGSKTQYSAFK